MRSISEARVILAALSSFLSVAGCLTILLTYYCYRDLKRPARKLLLYLSAADLATALNYLINLIVCGGACEAGKGGPTHHGCHAGLRVIFAYIGVYFPVASFLWTSAIAWFVYHTANEPERDLVQTLCESPPCSLCGWICSKMALFGPSKITQPHRRSLLPSHHRLKKQSQSQSHYHHHHYYNHPNHQGTIVIMSEGVFFSLICWTVPLLNCLGLAMLSYFKYHSHLARPIGAEHSGGWCWAKGLLSGLVGGKSIEILTYGFIVCMYWKTYQLLRLRKIQNEQRREQSASLKNKRDELNQGCSLSHRSGGADAVGLNHSSSPSTNGKKKSSSINKNENGKPNGKPTNGTGTMTMMIPKRSSSDRGLLVNPSVQAVRDHQQLCKDVAILRNEWKMNELLSRLLLIPAIFIFLRIWGTLRMFLNLSPKYENSGLDPWISLMQAFCDPAQGFFNGVLFVAFVTPVRVRLKQTLKRHCCCDCGYFFVLRSLLWCECAVCCVCWWIQYGTPLGPRHAFRREVTRQIIAVRQARLNSHNNNNHMNNDEQELSDHPASSLDRTRRTLNEDTPDVQHGNNYLPAVSTEGKIRELYVSSACVPSSFQPLRMTITSAPSMIANSNDGGSTMMMMNHNNNNSNNTNVVMRRDYGSARSGSLQGSSDHRSSSIVAGSTGLTTNVKSMDTSRRRRDSSGDDSSNEDGRYSEESSTEVFFLLNDLTNPTEHSNHLSDDDESALDEQRDDSSVSTMSLDDEFDDDDGGDSDMEVEIDTTVTGLSIGGDSSSLSI